jgi:predicted transcriptional regulator
MKQFSEMATKLVKKYLKDQGGHEWGHTFEHHEEKLANKFSKALQAVHESQEKKIKVMREALQFYATGKNIKSDIYGSAILDDVDFDYVNKMYGKRAREALALSDGDKQNGR